jgi:hypothetical protein
LWFWLVFDGTYLERIAEAKAEADDDGEGEEEDAEVEAEAEPVRRLIGDDEDDDQIYASDLIGEDDELEEEDEIANKLNTRLVESGYDSFSSIELLGTFFIVIFYQVLVLIIVRIMLIFENLIFRCTGKKWDRLRNFYAKMKKELIWNGFIRIVLESYLEVVIAVMIV